MAGDMFNGDLEFHEAANLFPLDEESLYILVDDIRAHGQLESIKLYQGKILDGRRRYLACKQLGIEPEFKTVKPADPIAYSLSLNLKRRNLNPSQCAMVAARAADYYEARAKERMSAGGKAGGEASGAARRGETKGKDNCPYPSPDAGQARDQAGEMLGISGRTVDRAKAVLGGSPALAAAVDAGKLSVSAAALATKRPKDEQDALAARAMAGKVSRPGKPLREESADGGDEKQDEETTRLKGVAFRRAEEANNSLAKIPKNNPFREDAFRRVIKWIRDTRKKVK